MDFRLNILLAVLAGVGASATTAKAAVQQIGPCQLPADLQKTVAAAYPGRKIVEFSDLNSDDKALFQKEHHDACPGAVQLDFYGDGKPTMALALTTPNALKGKTELVVAHQIDSVWKTETLETTDGSAPVVWSEKPGTYEGLYKEKKIRAKYPVIVFCGYESWAILYAWTGQSVVKTWLSD
jgi:hypothetical protein